MSEPIKIRCYVAEQRALRNYYTIHGNDQDDQDRIIEDTPTYSVTLDPIKEDNARVELDDELILAFSNKEDWRQFEPNSEYVITITKR